MKLACVIQRYGPDIIGGSEAHCRQLAERLAARHEVEVLTTCAADYLQWNNALPEGWTTIGPVRVLRVPVARQRDPRRLAEVSERAFARCHRPEDERAWFEANGPEAPGLVEHLRAHASRYDLVLFWAFRYYHSYFGLPVVEDRAVLVPTAEEDPVLDFAVLKQYFQRPRGYLFLTEEERAQVTARAGGRIGPAAVIGTGLESARPSQGHALAALRLADPFVLYVGRVDPSKGCDALVRHFSRYLVETGRDVTLVLAGPVQMALPDHPRIRVLGFIPDEVRDALVDRARLLVMPSPYESLCIALLDAWNRGLPALVNGCCSVLRGQVRRAGGGLHYGTYHEFSAALSWLLDHPDEARQLGRQGQAYVEAEYRWPLVMARVEGLLCELGA